MSEPTFESVFSGQHRLVVAHGDCLEVLKTLPDASVDSVVTDPPAGVSFMQANWDSDKGGRDQWIAWLSDVMSECLRVLKPGGHALVWSLPRTSHWTGMAIENAGFDVRDCITHLFGTGFPKSLDVSKAIDKAAGAEREVIGFDASRARPNRTYSCGAIGNIGGNGKTSDRTDNGATLTAPATDAAKAWDGWGTALKPAAENWWLVRKPLSGPVAQNVIQHGTGAINVDGCRVATSDTVTTHGRKATDNGWDPRMSGNQMPSQSPGQMLGRWPANVLLSHAEECGDGCAEGCPVAELDRQSGVTKIGNRKAGDYATQGYNGARVNPMPSIVGDSGGASRFFNTFEPEDVAPFFYSAKPSTRERDAGLDDLPVKNGHEVCDREEGSAGAENPRAGARTPRRNIHPTVKGQALMRHLVRLVTPPGGIVLDPFAGSGSTLVAAITEGFRCIGIERENEYIEIARRRVEHASSLPTSKPKKKSAVDVKKDVPTVETSSSKESSLQLDLWSSTESKASS